MVCMPWCLMKGKKNRDFWRKFMRVVAVVTPSNTAFHYAVDGYTDFLPGAAVHVHRHTIYVIETLKATTPGQLCSLENKRLFQFHKMG